MSTELSDLAAELRLWPIANIFMSFGHSTVCM